MAIYEGLCKEEMKDIILQWNYDYHSATYLLLLQKKMRGKPLRLIVSKPQIARPLFEQPQPVTPYTYRERSKSVECELETYANSPIFVSVKQKPPKKCTADDKENFAVPCNHSSQSHRRTKRRDRDLDKSSHRKPGNTHSNTAEAHSTTPMSKLLKSTPVPPSLPPPPPAFDNVPKTPKAHRVLDYSCITPTAARSTPVHLVDTDYAAAATMALSPARSYDSALNDIRALEKQNTPVHEKTQSVDSQLHEVHFNNTAMGAFSGKKKSRKLGGSFERVLNLLTPRKSKNGKDELRKTKAQHNVSMSNKFNADEALEKIRSVVEEKRLKFALFGWTIRVMMSDDWGKLHLAFDLEVCQHSKTGAVAVRRKRIKGDSWHYKKYCEDILRSSGF